MTVSQIRKALLAKTAIAVKQLGIEEEDFRDLLEQRYAQRSRTKLSDRQLTDLVEHLKTLGFRPTKRRAGPRAKARPQRNALLGKIRALWISGWHLGVVRDRSDDALSAFARNITGVERAEWQHGEDAMKTIEGLKDFLTREAGVEWRGWFWYGHAAADYEVWRRDRLSVLLAQARKLRTLGKLKTGDPSYLAAAIGRIARPEEHYAPKIEDLSAQELDSAIAAFGRRIRKAEGIPEADEASHG